VKLIAGAFITLSCLQPLKVNGMKFCSSQRRLLKSEVSLELQPVVCWELLVRWSDWLFLFASSSDELLFSDFSSQKVC